MKKHMERGDIIVPRIGSAGWHAVKILAIDTWPGGEETFHCLSYAATPERPTSETVDALDIALYHAPIDGRDFRANWEVLCSPGIVEGELVGFHEYLRLTDFPRYASVTGVDVDAIIQQALSHYREACALGDREQRLEAIAEYDQAIELFPPFFEAIDNRAFTLMELGRIEEALRGFENSLRVNPDGHAAFFSRGECLLKLGRFDDAEAAFRAGALRFPEHRADYERFEELTQMKRRAAPRG